MHDLTVAQQKTLDFVRDEVLAGRLVPTHREIANHFGFKSHRAAACHLNALKRKGFIESEKGKARSLRVRLNEAVFGLGMPLLGSIPAGFGEDKEQAIEGNITAYFPLIGFTPTSNSFALRVSGDSMIGRNICDGDIIVLERGREPRNGEIVAALIDRKSTLKTFILKNGKPFLRAENPKYPNLIPSEELTIQGVFRALIRESRQ